MHEESSSTYVFRAVLYTGDVCQQVKVLGLVVRVDGLAGVEDVTYEQVCDQSGDSPRMVGALYRKLQVPVGSRRGADYRWSNARTANTCSGMEACGGRRLRHTVTMSPGFVPEESMLERLVTMSGYVRTSDSMNCIRRTSAPLHCGQHRSQLHKRVNKL
jgi:ribosomal protein L32